MNHHRFSKKVFALILAFAVFLPVVPAQAVTVTPDLSYRFYMVGNSHIDTAWRWTLQHTAEVVIYDTFNRQVNALKSNPTYRFTASCSTHYKWAKEYFPDTYADIKALVANGQWGLAGGQFVEPDLNVMEGETFARHGLYAQHFFLNEFGRIAEVALDPDVFGMSGQFPQFIRKTGMTSYVATKMNWNTDPADGALDPGPWSESSNGRNSKGRESDLFWWEGIDGTDVLSYNCYIDYVGTYATSDFRSSSNQVFNRISRSGSFTNSGRPNYNGTYYYDYDSNIKYALGMFGNGDHGGGPSTGTTANNHGWPAANSGGTNGPTVLAATLEEYYRDVRIPGVGTSGAANGANRDASLMTKPGVSSLDRVYRHAGENYFSMCRGTYTSWSRVKKNNRQLNNLSQTAEQAATLGFWTKSLDNNSNKKFELSWERICINTMHDILPGSSGPPVYYQTFMNYELCRNLLTNVQNNALTALAYRADTTVDEGVPVFVYNPSSWRRDGETTTTVTLDKRYPYIKVFDGATELPVTVVDNRANGVAKISFIAKAVPSLGYKVFKAVGSETPSALTTDVRVTANDADSIVVENDNLRFTISKTTGNMPSLINKKDGNREVFYQTSTLSGNELQWKLDTGGNDYPAWDMVNSEFGGVSQVFNRVNTVAQPPTIVINTPEKVTIKVVQTISDSANPKPTLCTRYITLLAGSDKIDVRFELDWQMFQRNLKVAFPVDVDARAASYEIAYGAMDAALDLKRLDAVVPPSSATNPLMSNSITGIPAYAGALGRPAIRDTTWNAARFEHAGQKWMDVTADSGTHGMSILNDAKYGFDVLRMVKNGSATSGTGTDSQIPDAGGTYIRTRMTVVRSPISANNDYTSRIEGPNNTRIDIGPQDFNYSIYPHAGTWQAGKTSVKAHEFNFPMQSFQAVAGAGDGILGKEKSFFGLNKDNVVIGAVKNQHDEQSNRNKIVVRVWETSGANTTGVVLTLPSNVIAAREVNILEHDYNELSNDNIDNPISKKLEAKPIVKNGATVSFDICKYEILTMELIIDPYTGAGLELKQEKVDLSAAFDLRGTTPTTNFRAANLDGNGNTIPEQGWKEARIAGVDYQGIKFQLGPDTAENFVTASNQTIPVGKAGYNKVYLLGLAGKIGVTGGKFIVNYADGSSAEKNITFADWTSPLTGWAPYDNMDTRPYVYDSIAQVFSHWHDPTRVQMTRDNYLYVYFIDVDEAKTIASITLPDASGIKIAGITLTNSPISGFGSTNEDFLKLDEEYYQNFSDEPLGYEIGSNVEKQNIAGPVEPVAHQAFTNVLSGPAGYTTNEGPNQILTNNGSSKWCGAVLISTANFYLDAGSQVRLPGYVIRGANDDMSYPERVLHTWTIAGSNDPSASGVWTTISAPGAQGSGWTSNYQTRFWQFDMSAIPEEGFRYYRLQITHYGTSQNGVLLGATGTYYMQFSYFGLVAEFMENGALTARVRSGVTKQANNLTIETVNGPNILTLSGKAASFLSAPYAAKNYTSIKKGISIKVYPDTKLGYMLKPSDRVGAHMALDVKFADGTRLKDLNAVDQYGIGMNPKAQGIGNRLIPGQWNYVETDLGKVAEGKVVSEIILGFEIEGVSPGSYIEGSLDNVVVFRGDGDCEDLSVYAALYTAGGKLVDMKGAPVRPRAFNTVPLNPAFVFDMSAAGEGSYVKTYLWTLDGFVPITESCRYQF